MFFLFHHRFIRAIALVIPASICVLTCSLAFSQEPYQVVDHWKIGGNGSWDYLVNDPTTHLLYVTHRTRVEIVDTTTGKEVAAITGLKNAHGVALDTEGQFGYISDGLSNDVMVFDRHTFKRQSGRNYIRPIDQDGLGIQRQEQHCHRDRCRHQSRGRDDRASRQT